MPSVSKKQQKFMGIVRAIQKGEADPSDFNKDAQDAAKKMKKSSVKKYAKTKHKGLPNKKVNEAQVTKSIMTNPNNRKLYFTLVDGNDVKLIDAKTWLKSSLKDVSSTVNQDKVIKSIVRKQKQFNKKVEWNQWKSKNKPSFVEQMKWLMDNGFVKNVNKGGIKEGLTPAEVKKERELFKKTGELPPRLKKIADDYEKERKAFYQKMKKKFKGNVKGDVEDIVVPGLEWMSKLGESAQRDYKAEYKKFQSSPKAKKYRAELNKYNRQKGTYGNGDGKDASHKGGKIVGFESQSKNRGRAEKSRLKKEITDYVDSIIDEDVITFSKKEMDQLHKGKLKKGDDEYVYNEDNINENPAAIAAAQRMVVQSKGNKVSVNTARNSRYKDKDPAAHKKAKSMFQKILDKFRKKNESQTLLQIAKQLKEVDESIDEIKVWDLNEKCWKGYEKKGMKTMFGKRYPNCVKKKKSESVNEVKIGRYDIGMGSKGNGITLWNRNVEKAGDYKSIAHIAPNGKITNYEKRQPKEVTAFIQKIAKGMKDKPKGESVNEKVLGGKDVTSGIDKNTKITFDKRIPNKKLAGKTYIVVKKGINTFNLRPDGSGNERDTKTLDAPTILQLLKNKTIRKIVNSKGKKLNKESVNEFKTIYNKNKAAMKIRSLQRDKAAKVYKVDKKRTKYQGKDLIVYNLLTKNKNHSTNQNPYGLDMMKGAYLIPVEESINEETFFDPNGQLKKYMDKVLKQAGIRVIKYDPMKQSFYNGTWGGFYTVASSNMTDMPGQGKVKRSSAVLPVYIDKKNQIELGVSGKGFKLGKAGSSQVLKNLKSFKKSDLEESINERAWTPAQEKAVKELDKKFYKLIGKKGIEPYSYEASQMWTSGGFRKEMRKIFGKDVKESVNENISDSQKLKIYNSLKKGDIVSIKYDSTIAKGSKFHPFLVTKGKTKLMKGKIERIIMVPAGGSKAKRYLYNRGGRISLALGDMAASIVDMKKGKVNEGSCGYGVDGKLGEKPAGPHLIKKKKKKIKEDIEMSKGVKKLMKIADEGYGKVGGTTVDSMSASLFKQIYNKVNDDIKKQLNTKNEKQLVRIIAGMWKKFGKNVKIGSSL